LAESPYFHDKSYLFTGEPSPNRDIVWVDRAVLFHQITDADNILKLSEHILGPLTSILRYFNEKVIADEFQDDPQLIFTSTTMQMESSTMWFREMLAAIMHYGGMTKSVVTESSLEKTFGVHHREGGKWLCARKAILPGHFSTPVAGEFDQVCFFFFSWWHVVQSQSFFLLVQFLFTGRVEKHVFRQAVCSYFDLRCEWDERGQRSDAPIPVLLFDEKPKNGDAPWFGRFVFYLWIFVRQ
jgi:hypothetical protein